MSPAEAEPAATAVPVAAIVPARNSRWLADAVAAIRGGTLVPEEILVVDDGSRPPVVAPPGARVLRTTGLGRAGARNVGARQVSASYVWFVDSDVVVGPDTLARLVDALDDGVGGAMAVYAERGGSGYESFRLAHHRFHVLRNPEPRHVSAACLLVRRSTFEEIGGFPDLPAMEDIAFGVAGWRRGLRWRSVPAATVRHMPRPSWRDAVVRDHRERGMAAVLLAAREGPVLEHAASPRELVAFAGSLACLGGAIAPLRRRVGVLGAGLALLSWADGPWLRHALRHRGTSFAAASLAWLLVFRTAVATGAIRAYLWEDA